MTAFIVYRGYGNNVVIQPRDVVLYKKNVMISGRKSNRTERLLHFAFLSAIHACYTFIACQPNPNCYLSSTPFKPHACKDNGHVGHNK